jgi:long-chain acyl-CoA synthetase
MSYLDKPWTKSYKLGPYKLADSLEPFPKEPLFKVLDDAAEKHPSQTAIFYLGRTLNYQDLKAQVDRLASALAGLGVEKGDRVCVFLPNCPEFILSDWAIAKCGAAVVPTSVLRTDEGLLHEVGNSDSKVIICREEHLDRIQAIKEQCNTEHIVVTSTAGYDVEEVSTSLPDGAHEFRQLLNEGSSEPPVVDIDPMEDLCELAFTGGATGVPKGVMITHFNRHSGILQGFPWLMQPLVRGFVGKSSILISLPLFHAYGHYAHQSAACLGLRIILLPDSRDTDLMAEYIREYRPMLVPGVPTQFMRLTEAELGRSNVMLLSGAAPLPIEVAAAIKQKTGVSISEGYGLTETSSISHFNVSAFGKITGFMATEKHGIGIPCPDTECKLIDPETGQEVPFGDPGEVVLRGPQVMKGYWSEVGSGLTEDGWLHTGDIGVMDEDGYFQIVDRIKDMVNVSGLKVYTTKVDDVIHNHPAVLMAAAFGIPDPEITGSERVMAAVQLRDEFKGKVTEEELRAFCKNNLPPYAVPIRLEFRDELPLTVTEKVFKKALRDEEIAKAEAGSA